MKNILIIEDNAETLILIEEALGGFDLDYASSIEEARKKSTANNYDLVLLDIQLPDGNGLKFLAELNKNQIATSPPVFMLTGEADTMHKVTAFSVGAQDYICKPFDPLELKARVEARFRLEDQRKRKEQKIQIGTLCVDIPKQKCWIKGNESQPIDLTTTEFRLLLNFARHPEKVFSRTKLLDQIWGSEVSVTDRTVDTHVGHLRKKIKDSTVKIETVVGEGYRLVVSVKD